MGTPNNLRDLAFEFENFNPDARSSIGSRNSGLGSHDQNLKRKQINVFEDLKTIQDFIALKKQSWKTENLLSEFLLDYELLYSHFPTDSGAFEYFTLRVREVRNLSRKSPGAHSSKMKPCESAMQKNTEAHLRDNTDTPRQNCQSEREQNGDRESSLNIQNLLILSPVADSSRPLHEGHFFRSEKNQPPLGRSGILNDPSFEERAEDGFRLDVSSQNLEIQFDGPQK